MWSFLAGNIYLWLFASALFTGAALCCLVSAVHALVKGDRLWSRRMPAFYVFAALSLGVLSGSAFFVDFGSISWSSGEFVFFAGFIFFWFLVLRFLFPWGGAVLLLLSAAAVFLYSALGLWQNTDMEADIARMRLLSMSDTSCEYEITSMDGRISFYTSVDGPGKIRFYRLVLSPVLFFIPGRTFIFMLPCSGQTFHPRFFAVFNFLSGKTALAELENVHFTIPRMLVLREYLLSYDDEAGKFIFRLVR